MWRWVGHTDLAMRLPRIYQNLYLPLRLSTSFRLLELQSGCHPSPVRCNLLQTSLEDTPSFDALSYCWGDLADTRTVNCNGRNYPVTSNLYKALVNLRRPDRKRILCIDALCIDQRNYAERDQQLHLMRQIYQKANRVIAWIGDRTESIGCVKMVFNRLRSLEHRFGGLIYIEPSAQHLSSLGLPEETSPVWNALRCFFRRAWFQRVWVIQEVANASQIDITCGQVHLEWDDLVYAARCFAESPMFAATDMARICQHIEFLDTCRRMTQQATEGQLSLFDLLHRSRRCGATDLRDKIYGLYPLLQDQSILPKPSYKKAIDTLYKETAIHLIRTTRGLDVLSCAGTARDPHAWSLKLPSWVPDWHSCDPPMSLALSQSNQKSGVEFEVSSDLTELTLSGNYFDSIVSLSDTIMSSGDTLNGTNINPHSQQWPNSRVLLEPTNESVRIVDVLPKFAAEDDFSILDLAPTSVTKGWLKFKRNKLIQIFFGRRLFRSASGYLGLAPSHATVGDKIVNFSGGSVLYVTRQQQNVNLLIGECVFVDLLGDTSPGETNSPTRITLK